MKTKAFLASAAIFGAALVSASPASALPVSIAEGIGLGDSSYGSGPLNTTVHLDENMNGDFLDSSDVNYNTYFGSFDLTINGNTFVGFCLDLLDHLKFGNTYPYTGTTNPFDDGPIDSGALAQIETYVDANSGDVLNSGNATKFAAFQLGLWELVYDGPITDGADYLGTGWLQATGTTGLGSVIDTAVDYLDAIFDPTTNGYVTTYLDSLSTANPPDKQDLIVIQKKDGSIPIVPLPAAGWLLGGGLISLFGFGRFGKARRAAA